MSTKPIQLSRSVRLWPGDKSESRRASWLELFFDLIFVAAVSQVGVPLGQDYSIHGLVRYSLMFLLIWWAWFGHTMYATRFDADDVVHRLLTLVQIFAAAAMAANASCIQPGDFGHIYPTRHSSEAASTEPRHSPSGGVGGIRW